MPRGDSFRGFTLIELCSVLVIAGILMALAGPKLLETPAFNQRGYTDELGAVLRTAGDVAFASGCDVQVKITPGVGFSAAQPALGPSNACAGPYTRAVLNADGSKLSGKPPSNADVANPVTLVFAPQGVVTGPTTVAVSGTPAGVTQPLTLQVDPQSGFVTVP